MEPPSSQKRRVDDVNACRLPLKDTSDITEVSDAACKAIVTHSVLRWASAIFAASLLQLLKSLVTEHDATRIASVEFGILSAKLVASGSPGRCRCRRPKPA